MSGIQQVSFKRSYRSLSRRKSSVNVTRIKRFSSRIAHHTPQINATKQQLANDNIVNNVKTATFPLYRNGVKMFSSLPEDIIRQRLFKQNKMTDLHSKILTQINARRLCSSKLLLCDMSFDANNNNRTLHRWHKSNRLFPLENVLSVKQRQDENKNHQKESMSNLKELTTIKRQRKYKVCGCCSKCCCLALIPILTLLLIGLAAMSLGLSTINKTTTTTITSVMSTASITTSAVSSATTTTPHPCGIPVSLGSSSSIFSTTSSIISYTCQYYEWISLITGTVTLAFQFQNDYRNWFMDDVSVTDGTNEILANGGFQSNSFSPGRITTTPNGNCDSGTSGAQIVNTSCRTGSYCLKDGCGGRSDQISQSFMVTAGQSYFISFWLQGDGSSILGDANVTVTLS